MTGSSSKLEVLDGPQRRRRWTASEKLAIVQETYGICCKLFGNSVRHKPPAKSGGA